MISTLTNLETGLTVHKITGELHAEALLKSLRMLKDPVTRLVLWDLREVYNLRDTDPAWLQNFSIHILSMPIEANGRAAIVFASRADHEIGQQFKTFANAHKPPFEIGLFESIESARLWLEQA